MSVPTVVEKTLPVLALTASSASQPRADIPTIAHALHRVRDLRSAPISAAIGNVMRRVLTGLTSDPAHRMRPSPVLVRSLPDTLVAPSGSCRSTFCFLPALYVIGNVFSIDPDIPCALA
ncbi:hypothetical protein C8Q74DRAFT_1367137 [Fomes fomentarius]|nr:hypothetical protein C8Q74DRAFT_1367137 [Fomes fomentarius]